MPDHRVQKRPCADRIAIHLEMRRDKRAQQPSPHRPLVIGRVAAALVPGVLAHVRRVVWSQTPQSVRCQQVPGAHIHNGPLPVQLQWAGRQRHRKDLIRTQGRIVPVRPVQHIVAAAQGIVPEPGEPGLRAISQFRVFVGGLFDDPGQRRHGPQGVVPERIHLHRLADTRRDDPAPNLGIHPRELHTLLAGPEQPVRMVQVDAVAGAAPVPVHDFGQHGKQLPHQPVIARRRVIGADRLHIPERGIHGIVFGHHAGIRETVGHHATVHEGCVRFQDQAGDGGASRRQRKPGQCDHRVTAPVDEPMVARDDRATVGVSGGRPRHDELLGGKDRLLHPRLHLL